MKKMKKKALVIILEYNWEVILAVVSRNQYSVILEIVSKQPL